MLRRCVGSRNIKNGCSIYIYIYIYDISRLRVKDVARAQKLFCGCILWPIFGSDVADLNNFPLEISTDSVSVISNGTKGLAAK